MEARAFAGAPECGDQYCVRPCADGTVLAVADGLGHGSEAAAAARAAIREVEARSGESLGELALRCHRQLRETRGVVIGMAFFPLDANRLEWLGVGNVQALLIRRRAAAAGSSLLSGRGVLGHDEPALLPQSLPVEEGDLLIVATDGVDGSFAGEPLWGNPQQLAHRLLSRFATGGDDALVLVARYQGRVRDVGTRLARGPSAPGGSRL